MEEEKRNKRINRLEKKVDNHNKRIGFLEEDIGWMIDCFRNARTVWRKLIKRKWHGSLTNGNGKNI